MADREADDRRFDERMRQIESLLWGGPGAKEPGLVFTVTQLTSAIANQSLQIAEMAKDTALRINMMTDNISKKMDVVVDENNQPVSITILANDIGHIKKIAGRILTYLALIGAMAFLILGRQIYTAVPILQHLDK